MISHDFVRQLLSDGPDIVYGDKLLTRADVLEKFNRFEARAFVRSNPTLRECPSCNGVVSRGESRSMDMQCGHCGFGFCWNCMREAHTPASCSSLAMYEEKEVLTSVDDPTAELLARDCRKCPNCKASTYRTEGCNHMTCSICHHDW